MLAGVLAAHQSMPKWPAVAGASSSSAATTVVLLTATPGLRFDGKTPGPTIRVRVRSEVRLILANKDSLSHDIWIVVGGERAPYLQPLFPGARTGIVLGGKQEEIRFNPDRSGLFKYVCTVPGHDNAMFGQFIVESGP